MYRNNTHCILNYEQTRRDSVMLFILGKIEYLRLFKKNFWFERVLKVLPGYDIVFCLCVTQKTYFCLKTLRLGDFCYYYY